MPSGYSNGVPLKPPSNLGKHHSNATKLKMSIARLGTINSEETRKKISISNMGKKYSEETKEKHRIYMLAHPVRYWLGKNKPLSEETKNKIREANTGKKASEETRKKMSEYQKNNPIKYWLGKKRPDISLSRMGENNPNWKGGKSFEIYPQDWTDSLKESIRERDNYNCLECKLPQNELKGLCKKLHVHHIDYDKDNLNPDNLISLCHSCHGKTTHNREYWTEYFKLKILEIYA